MGTAKVFYQLLDCFCTVALNNTEDLPKASTKLMTDIAAIVLSKKNEKVPQAIRDAAITEAPVVKDAIYNTDKLKNVCVPWHSSYQALVHDDIEKPMKMSGYLPHHASIRLEPWKGAPAVIERLIEITRADRDLGLVMGLSGVHVVGFSNERLVHDFELGDQIIAVGGSPVGSSMELCQAIYARLLSSNGKSFVLRFAVKRSSTELLSKLIDDGYVASDHHIDLFSANRDLSSLAGAALKCGLVVCGHEDFGNPIHQQKATYVLGQCCDPSNSQISKEMINGMWHPVIREIRVQLQFIPGRPRSLGLELALGSTRIRRFALNAANCLYVGNQFFMANDVVTSVGGVKVSTELELKEAYTQAREHHEIITFIVARDAANTSNTTNANAVPQATGANPAASPAGQGGYNQTAGQPQINIPENKNAPVVDYGLNKYAVTTTLTRKAVKDSIPPEYKKALEKVEKRGWAQTKWDRGYTILHWAARSGNLELCKFLIAAVSADPFHKDDRNLCPSDHARRKGFDEVADYLNDLQEQ